MDRYEELRTLIEVHSDIAEFREFGDGASDELIAEAESVLGFSLPESYKWWLRSFGGGEICGEEIYSLYNIGFDNEQAIGDIVCAYRRDMDRGGNPLLVRICDSDIDGSFSFDRSKVSECSEFAVFSNHLSGIYANDFLDFLKKRIELCGS